MISSQAIADNRNKLLWIAGSSVYFGMSAKATAETARKEGKKNSESLVMVGDLLFVVSMSCLAFYYDGLKLSGSKNRITASLSKKF